MPAKHLSFMATPDADTEAICTMKYMFVTNTVAVEQAVKQSFVDGDKLILKATGYLGDQQTGSAEINLAEFTAAQGKATKNKQLETEEQKKALIEAKMKTMTEEEKKALIEAKLKSMTPEQKKALIEAKKKKLMEDNAKKQ